MAPENVAAIGEGAGAETPGPSEITTIEDLRRWSATEFKGMLRTTLPAIGSCTDGVDIGPSDGRRLLADIVVPNGEPPFPTLVYLHGGGWVAGNRVDWRPVTFEFAAAGFAVISIDYSLAPEYPFPAAFNDACRAVDWASRHITEYGGDPDSLVLAGDSVGANLAAGVAAHLRSGALGENIRSVLLFFGMYDFATVPKGETEEAQHLSNLIDNAYLGDAAASLMVDPRVSPISIAAHLPPAYIAVGALDGLRAQSESLAAALSEAALPYELNIVDEMPHAFVQLPYPEAVATLKSAAEFARQHMAGRSD